MSGSKQRSAAGSGSIPAEIVKVTPFIIISAAVYSLAAQSVAPPSIATSAPVM